MHAAVIIDDDEAIRATLKQFLEDYQFTVKTFPDGLQALIYLVGRSTPHLVIVDYAMPQMNGEAFLRRALEEIGLHENGYILFAARPLAHLPPTVASLLTTWNISFLTKPFNLIDLEALIQPFIG